MTNALTPKQEPLQMQGTNPGAAPVRVVNAENRRPMALPSMTLEVPEIPGYFLYWHLGSQVERALQAGYEFVDSDEVTLNSKNIADDADKSGNTDLGSRVSIVAGTPGAADTSAPRLYLMKIRNEWRTADVKALEARNESIAVALRGGVNSENMHGAAPHETPQDRSKRYLKTGQDLFYPKRSKG